MKDHLAATWLFLSRTPPDPPVEDARVIRSCSAPAVALLAGSWLATGRQPLSFRPKDQVVAAPVKPRRRPSALHLLPLPDGPRLDPGNTTYPATASRYLSCDAPFQVLAEKNATSMEPGLERRYAEIQCLRSFFVRELLYVCEYDRLEEYRVSVSFASEQGSYFLPMDNRIDIYPGLPLVVTALHLVHEATHARYENEGRTPSPICVTREEFVRRLIEEEAEGQANFIRAKAELKVLSPRGGGPGRTRVQRRSDARSTKLN